MCMVSDAPSAYNHFQASNRKLEGNEVQKRLGKKYSIQSSINARCSQSFIIISNWQMGWRRKTYGCPSSRPVGWKRKSFDQPDLHKITKHVWKFCLSRDNHDNLKEHGENYLDSWKLKEIFATRV
ncbi:hypothetical protein HanIR_Chr07g0341521 [Helianthus annuus]|nr:hypothetical protein HanIR_Chr07g0341521 [Helianthus annuus]